MVYDYVVTLENRTRRYIDNLSVLLILMSLAFFIEHLVRRGLTMVFFLGTILVLILFGISLYLLLLKQQKVSFSRSLLISGFLWLLLPVLHWVGFLLIGLGLLESLAKKDLEIGFSARQIVINSLIKRRFNWSDFNSILLKDDLLTMDFKNNRLLQRMTIDDQTDADVEEFNAYCQQHLSTEV